MVGVIEGDSRIGFPEIRGSFFGAPMMSIRIFWGGSFCALLTGLFFNVSCKPHDLKEWDVLWRQLPQLVRNYGGFAT